MGEFMKRISNEKKDRLRVKTLIRLDDLSKSIYRLEDYLNESTNDYNEIMNMLENINNRVTKI